MTESQHITLRSVAASLEVGARAVRAALWAPEISEIKVNYSGHCYLSL